MPDDIIVTGGNSVEIDLPAGYMSTNTQLAPSLGRQTLRHPTHKLVSLLVDGKPVQNLSPTSQIIIQVDDSGQTP
jgi:hypothetical protein